MKTLLTCALLLSASTAFAQDATDNDYELKADTTTKKLKVGQEGTWGLQIIAKNGFKVSDETPLSATLTAPEGLTIKNAKLVRKDAVDPKGKSPEFKTGITAAKAGSYEVTAQLVFFLCTEKLCQRMSTKHTVTVAAQ